MAGIWYRAGTVAVTSGSTKVVGTGTTWRSGVYKPDKGHIFWGPDGRAYEVDYVESDTVLYLVTAYVGGSATGQAYSIVISITGQVPAFSRELSAFVAYHQSQMDGWQQLLTGTGDVTLTAPDGTKITTPSWDKVMNAGYGVVAQAATQAGIATAEATKAAASAGVAANIVAAAALPIPDLWAPLTDDLRLITGHGREVKVGDDVVAKLVNFSRATTATKMGKDGLPVPVAVNEPRFENEGLLIELQIANLVAHSEELSTWAINAPCTLEKQPGIFTKITPTEIYGGVYTSVSGLAAGEMYTISFWAYSDKDASGFMVGVYGSAGATTTLLTSKKKRYTFTFVATQPQISIIACGGLGSVLDPLYVGGFQVENLSYASSYIPTYGTAVTRARDVVSLPKSNLPNREHTIAVQLSIRDTRYRYSWVLQGGYICLSIQPDGTVRGWDSSAEVVTHSLGSSIPNIVVGCRLRANDRSAFAGGVITTKSNSGVTEPGTLFPGEDSYLSIGSYSGAHSIGGHIKNIRVWEPELSDEQIKGIG